MSFQAWTETFNMRIYESDLPVNKNAYRFETFDEAKAFLTNMVINNMEMLKMERRRIENATAPDVLPNPF